MGPRTRKSPLRHLLWIIPLVVLDFFIFRWLALRPSGCQMPSAPPPPAVEDVTPPPPPPPPPPRPFGRPWCRRLPKPIC